MRFDDRLATALRGGSLEGQGAAAQWRQIIDLLAQAPAGFDAGLVAQALVQAHSLRGKVPAGERRRAVQSLAGRLAFPPLVQYLAHEEPAIASEAIAGADLADQQWADLVPQLPVRARGFLRLRDDLKPRALSALAQHAARDFVLSDARPLEDRQPSVVPHPDRHGPVAIRDLVERIERFRSAREEDRSAPEPDVAPVLRFLFETDDHGTVVWGEGAPPGAIVGIGIAEPALDDGPGPDAHAAAAFRQRMPIVGARMRLLGSARLQGDWRVEAEPFFDPLNGRFRGYRGIMRRPNPAEDARGGGVAEPQTDQLRQLVHELRTPLNAIVGFAEIIEQQLFGPASDDYRALAASILEDSRRLLSGIEDLDLAARLETGRWERDDGCTDPGWLTERLVERLRTLADERSVTLNLVTVEPIRPFAIAGESCERMFARLLSAALLACEAGETLSGTLRTRVGARPQNRFLLSHPSRFLIAGEEAAFHGEVDVPADVGAGSDPAAPLLGVGFSLRLVRSLARNAGGDLRWSEEGLVLTLPAAADSQASHQR